MSDYYWDEKIEYLRKTRRLYYNDDYLEFQVKSVWKIDKPVSIVDFGCGFGYLGLKLLPLLPEGSSYTGMDKGIELIREARELFRTFPYPSEFIECDLELADIACGYDIAVSHAFLLHMADPEAMLRKMVGSVVDKGKVICFEPHWIAGMASYWLEDQEQSRIVRLGTLQKLYETDARRNGKNGNIGTRLPILLSRLGARNVECRVSDRVNFLDPNMDRDRKASLYQALREDGVGQPPGDPSEFVNRLVARGLGQLEAREQYEAELLFSETFGIDSWLTCAPNMKITFGTVEREGTRP